MEKWPGKEVLILEYPSKENKIILYQTDEGKVKVDVFFVEENFWMTQKTMGQLFDVQKAAVSKHLKNIYESGELDKASTVSIMETVQHGANGGTFFLSALFHWADMLITLDLTPSYCFLSMPMAFPSILAWLLFKWMGSYLAFSAISRMVSPMGTNLFRVAFSSIATATISLLLAD
jgi:hypothetical protein